MTWTWNPRWKRAGATTVATTTITVITATVTIGDAFSHGHSHSRWFGGYGQCHGFEQDNFTGGWINAGHAENVFGGTGFGRRIVPVARATRVRRRLYGALAVSGAYASAEVIAATISGSTALLADALHMLSDFISYALSIGIPSSRSGR